MIFLENKWLRIGFSQENGSIKELFDKKRNLNFLINNLQTIPYIIEVDHQFLTDFKKFGFEKTNYESSSRLKLVWETKLGIKLICSVELLTDSPEIIFKSEVNNKTILTVQSIEYPILPNLNEITEDGKEDYFVHSYATGFEIKQPLKNLDKEFRYMPYPESFSGSSMQFFSYYGVNKAGLYFATYDSEGYAKWLNFYKNNNGYFNATFIHEPNEIEPGNSYKINYPTIIRLIDGNGWYESADIYKQWAIQQEWCSKGPLAKVNKNNKATWLLEDIGLATFGINAKHNRSQWIEKYHEHINTKFFHILGPDWSNKDQNFINNIPGGMKDWFPTRFNQENISVIKKYGDKFAPFEFDYLFNFDGDESEKGKQAMQIMPKNIKSIDAYDFPFICPYEDFTKELHVKRDLQLDSEEKIDAIYYDISANNILKVCMNETHNHPVGAGKEIDKAYIDNYKNTKTALIKQSNEKYIPMGTEMMNERLLNIIDFYQARAGGRPSAPLEGWIIAKLINENKAKLIPLFTYVYHEYGGIRIDGWGKLSKEIGNMFYYTAARTYLWGGLYELNYEYSPMEMINDIENPTEEHYYPFELRGYKFSSEMANYINQFALMRTGWGNKFLAYGKMLKPISYVAEKFNYDWNLYNTSTNSIEYNSKGSIDGDTIVHSAWESIDGSIGLFFANTSEKKQELSINLEEVEQLASEDDLSVTIFDYETKISEQSVSKEESKNLSFSIPGRKLLMIVFEK